MPLPLLVWEPCFGSLSCANLAVPLDHEAADAEQIDLALIKIDASGERLGSLFVNPGGPGVSGFDFVRNGFRLDPLTAEHYDLIGFDPRGIGRSTAITCDTDRTEGPLPDFSPDDATKVEILDAAAARLAQDCARLDGKLLSNVRTSDVARDLDLMRQAVGDDALNYLGFSYGTLIGLLYADRFPHHVGHLVLDGVVDPTASLTDLLTQQAEAFERSFALLEQACSDYLACPSGGAAAAHETISADLKQAPPRGGLGPTEVDMAAVVTLYNDGLWPRYVSALGAATRGDYQPLESISDSYLGAVSFGAYAAVVCSDGQRPSSPTEWGRFADDLGRRFPTFGAVIANELRVCGHWPVAGAAERSPVTAASAAPIVVIGTTNDPATPLANAERVAEALDNARLVIVDDNRHTAYGSNSCVDRIVAHYFVDDQLPGPSSRC